MGAAPLPPDEAERLELLAELEVMDTEPDQAFDALTQMAAAICGTPISLVSLVDAARQWFKSRTGLEATETPREWAFCAHAIVDDSPVFEIPDARRDDRFKDNPLVTADPNIRFYAGVPLRPTGDHAVGTLCVIGPEPMQLSDEQRTALQRLGMIAEQQLRLRLAIRREAEATQRAAESERRYRYLTDNVADAVVVHDRELVIRYYSPSVPGFLGNAPDAELTRRMIRLHPEDHPEFLAALARLTEDEPTAQFEVRLDDGRGDYLYAGVHTRAVFENGDLSEYHTSFRDVTDLHDYRVGLERANRELQAAAAERSLLIRGVAHDLASPLAALRISTESMATLLKEPALVELGERLYDLSLEAEALVSDLLSVAEPATRRPLQKAMADVSEIVRGCVGRLAHADHLGPPGPIDLDLEVVEALVDARALGRVFTNLITNAMKHSPPATPIAIRLRRDGTHAVTTVSDLGPGIPEGERERVLEPYQRNVGNQEIEGSGLGLTIAGMLVAAHGGELTIGDNQPHGTAVTVRVPIGPIEAVDGD